MKNQKQVGVLTPAQIARLCNFVGSVVSRAADFRSLGDDAAMALAAGCHLEAICATIAEFTGKDVSNEPIPALLEQATALVRQLVAAHKPLADDFEKQLGSIGDALSEARG